MIYFNIMKTEHMACDNQSLWRERVVYKTMFGYGCCDVFIPIGHGEDYTAYRKRNIKGHVDSFISKILNYQRTKI